MIHRHLNKESTCDDPSTLTKPTIDDIIVRGVKKDWQTLGIAVKHHPEIRETTLGICLDRINNEDAMFYHPQHYHLWRNFCRHLQEKQNHEKIR